MAKEKKEKKDKKKRKLEEAAAVDEVPAVDKAEKKRRKKEKAAKRAAKEAAAAGATASPEEKKKKKKKKDKEPAAAGTVTAAQRKVGLGADGKPLEALKVLISDPQARPPPRRLRSPALLPSPPLPSPPSSAPGEYYGKHRTLTSLDLPAMEPAAAGGAERQDASAPSLPPCWQHGRARPQRELPWTLKTLKTPPGSVASQGNDVTSTASGFAKFAVRFNTNQPQVSHTSTAKFTDKTCLMHQDAGMDKELLDCVLGLGFHTPTPIQVSAHVVL